MRSRERAVDVTAELLEEADVDAGFAALVQEPIEVLLEAIFEEPDLAAAAVAGGVERVRRDLEKVAVLQSDRRQYPELASVVPARPLFILGMPRCGTSALQALMGADPAARMLRQWETTYFSPPPQPAPDDDPRILQLDEAMRSVPNAMRAMHPIGPLEAQECGGLLETSFRSSMFCMDLRVLPYFEWYLQCDSTPAYELHRMWLQQFQLHNPARWWILKIQEHMYHAPELLTVYPDAMLVQPHRDPSTVMASISSLISTLRQGTFSTIDPVALGEEMLRLWGAGLDKFMDFRDAHPEVPVCDVAYRDIVADPVGTVRSIYDFFGLEFSDDSEIAVKRWWSENPPNKAGSHRYTLDDWGLTDGRVRQVYGEYCERYGDFM
jgi:hypothetical protein